MSDLAKALWTPTEERVARSRMNKFAKKVNKADDLYSWSIEQPSEFWSQVWDECGVIGHKGDRVFVSNSATAPISTARFSLTRSSASLKTFCEKAVRRMVVAKP